MSEPIILIVDDNLDNLKLLSDMLGKYGYKTRRAISGDLALKALNAIRFDLILLDITMPDMDGYQVCAKIRANPQFADIPIIFISALSGVIDKVQAFKVGGADYITKPFQIEEVTARVANQIRIISLQKQLTALNKELSQHNNQLQQEHQDIKKSQARLVRNSLKDPITNLNTKLTFMGQLRPIINRARQQGLFNYILIVAGYEQLELYRSILKNESYNKCLIEIGKRIEELTIANSVSGRIGESQFAIAVENVPDTKQVLQIIKQIKQNLDVSFKVEKYNIAFNPDYGVVIGAKNYHNPEQLLQDAWIALSESVSKGCGSYQIFKPETKQKIKEELEMRSRFQTALKEQNLNIHYIPTTNSQTKQVRSLKAEISWQYSPETKLQLSQIVAIAVAVGSTSEFNYLIFNTVCSCLAEIQETLLWQKESESAYEPGFKLYLPLTNAQFTDPDVPGQIEQVLKQHNLEKEGLVIEFPAEMLVTQTAVTIKSIEAIQKFKIEVIPDCVSIDYLDILQKCKKELIEKSTAIYKKANKTDTTNFIAN